MKANKGDIVRAKVEHRHGYPVPGILGKVIEARGSTLWAGHPTLIVRYPPPDGSALREWLVDYGDNAAGRIERVMEPHAHLIYRIGWAAATDDDTITCGDCDGTGLYGCAACGCTGEPPKLAVGYCPCCDGAGEIECPHCEGRGALTV